jgi:hypothetical protein
MCKTCINYEIFKIITGTKLMSYSGDIPCYRCDYFNLPKYEYVPKQTNINIKETE